MQNKERRKLREVSVVLVLVVMFCGAVSAQTRKYTSDRYAVKDFGEFRLPQSLRPAYDSQVVAGTTNYADGSLLSFASPEKLAYSQSLDGAEIEVSVEGCDDRPCRNLTDMPDITNPILRQNYDQVIALFLQNLARIGNKLVKVKQELTIKDIGGGKATCFAFELMRINVGKGWITGGCRLENYDRRYDIGFIYAKDQEEYWEGEINQLLNSITIPDRSPKKVSKADRAPKK